MDPVFELSVPPLPWCVDLIRGVVAGAAVEMPVDRFQDLLLVTSRVATDLIEQETVQSLTVRLSADAKGVEVVMAGHGANREVAHVPRMVLEKLSTRAWQTLGEDGLVAGYMIV